MEAGNRAEWRAGGRFEGSAGALTAVVGRGMVAGWVPGGPGRRLNRLSPWVVVDTTRRPGRAARVRRARVHHACWVGVWALVGFGILYILCSLAYEVLYGGVRGPYLTGYAADPKWRQVTADIGGFVDRLAAHPTDLPKGISSFWTRIEGNAGLDHLGEDAGCDPWGVDIEWKFEGGRLCVRSAGPDATFGTPDDILESAALAVGR